MGNQAWDATSILNQQLREVRTHIERTKREHEELWYMIWPEFPWGIGLDVAYYVLAAWLEGCNGGTQYSRALVGESR
jgi:hypothetical protein